MDKSLDTGLIVDQEKISIHKYDYLDLLYHKAITIGSQVINNFLDTVLGGYEINLIKQRNSNMIKDYYSYPGTKERKLFYKKGNRFFRYF